MMGRPRDHITGAIVGLGNVLLTDDGVGVHAIRKLGEDAPAGIVLAEVGTAALDALELLESVDVMVAIDAVQAGGAPGSIYCFDLDDVDTRKDLCLHEFGIAAAMQLLPPESRPAVTILGVEPAVIDYGMQLSPIVAAILPWVVGRASTMIVQQIKTISE